MKSQFYAFVFFAYCGYFGSPTGVDYDQAFGYNKLIFLKGKLLTQCILGQLSPKMRLSPFIVL